MLKQFPAAMLPLVRCVADGGALAGAVAIDGGAAVCERCNARYEVHRGVLRMLDALLHPETEHERRIRERDAAHNGPPAAASLEDAMEIDATIEALDLKPQHRVLELGAGTGRFTRLIAPRVAELVAIDVSLESLNVTASQIHPDRPVALVQTDATRDVVASGSFDRILGTLASNLPDRESREASYRAAAQALAPGGTFVFSTHHFGIRARFDGHAPRGRYSEGGIYRRLLTAAEVRAEISPWFARVTIRPIVVVLPFTQRFGLPAGPLDRMWRRVPGLRWFGELLLVTAREPRARVSRAN